MSIDDDSKFSQQMNACWNLDGSRQTTNKKGYLIK